jgi:simple sugar transport system permease protein
MAISEIARTLIVPVLAVFTALVIGGIVIVFTDPVVLAAFQNFFSAPGEALRTAWESISTAYGALFQGALGSPYAISESLVASTPYIFAGLAVALGFRGGLFNIGAEGQIFIGALAATWVGYSLTGLPWFVHLPLALLAGALGGALWGAIPGYLKARTGAHEVVTTIMMNYIAFRLSDWLLNGFMKRLDPATGKPGFVPISQEILPSAYLPQFFPSPIRFHGGFFLALIFAFLVWYLLFKTTLGFDIRTVGANPNAARYAGMNITFLIVAIMAMSGALAGLAGTMPVLGVDHWLGQGFSSGYGFDSIALALLGNSHPLGVVHAAILFGTLRNGATRMQSLAGIPIDIISIIQALVIIFIAAPALIRWLYRIRVAPAETETVFTRGWGK